MPNDIRLKIKRQDSQSSTPYWQEFVLPYRPSLNVISCLMEIQRNPVDATGKKVAPVVWECNCLEEVCGACSMLINGKARQSCSALIDRLEQPVVLEPLSKFPAVRDLVIDRTVMFNNLKRVKAWINIDGTHDQGPGPRFPEKTRSWAYELSRCMTCGCCMESCPQVNPSSKFIGPTAIAQVRLMNALPNGENDAEERLAALMEPGGVAECGNAQNCERACPKEIPLLTSIAAINRQMVAKSIFGALNK
ncbi:MAG: succinate dehydrogenase iron-sulfur subunit [Peptococcaceae bacterium]|jgi:succinate dehydrogenase / fumarate reductase iron-sulfur subunit|nr:succinate dehydrogenase iron-sulfur subunit [Peptococcaceae bacterium]